MSTGTAIQRLAELRVQCGYAEDRDCSVDALIDYKNALEDELVTLMEPVLLIRVNERNEERIHLFRGDVDAEHFCRAVRSRGGVCSSREEPVNAGEDAERLIRAEDEQQ